MRFAIFSDIHSNLEALEAVLKDIKGQRITHLFCLGDIVGYAANPSECVEVIRDLECYAIRGNHDEMCIEDHPDMEGYNDMARKGLEYSRKHLSREQKNYLRDLPYSGMFPEYTFVHSCLHHPQSWIYVLSYREAALHFKEQTTAASFCGHTHFPIIFEDGDKLRAYPGITRMELAKDKRYLINVGSVGQPRDGDNRACYGIYEPESRIFEFRRIPYEIEKAQRKIIAAGLPELLAARLKAAM